MLRRCLPIVLHFGPKVGDFFLRKLSTPDLRCASDVTESHIRQNRFAELSRASVLELSNSGRVLAGFLQLISSFSELILMEFITLYAVLNSMNIFKHEIEENMNKNVGRSSSLRGT